MQAAEMTFTLPIIATFTQSHKQPYSCSFSQTFSLFRAHITSLSCSFLFTMATRPNLWKVLAFICAAFVRHPNVYTFAQVKRVLIDFTCSKQQEPCVNWGFIIINVCQIIVWCKHLTLDNLCLFLEEELLNWLFPIPYILKCTDYWILLVQTVLDFCQTMHCLC